MKILLSEDKDSRDTILVQGVEMRISRRINILPAFLGCPQGIWQYEVEPIRPQDNKPTDNSHSDNSKDANHG